MSHPLQAALTAAGLCLFGMLLGTVIKKSYQAWRDRWNPN